jgi:hypothetical protein
MVVTTLVQRGLYDMAVACAVGVILGGSAGIVLARGGGSSGSSNVGRRMWAAAGGGVGLGHAWTNTSIQIDAWLKGQM